MNGASAHHAAHDTQALYPISIALAVNLGVVRSLVHASVVRPGRCSTASVRPPLGRGSSYSAIEPAGLIMALWSLRVLFCRKMYLLPLTDFVVHQ